MILTYLDTSNLILLSQEKQNKSSSFNDFLFRWKENGNVLALSQIHLIELLQAKFQNTRIAHFNLLNDLIPFRYESENFFEREILIALSKKGFINPEGQQIANSLKMFSKEIENQDDPSLIYNSTNLISKIGLYKANSKAIHYSWKAKSSDTIHSTPKPRISKSGKNLLGKFFLYIFAKFVGINLSNKKNQNKTFELVLENFLFKVQVKSTLKSKFGKIEKAKIKNILSNIDLFDCKGLWLRKEVEKNLIKANDFDPNNEYDLNNIQYLPYVDIFLTDKRIFETTQQVLRRKDLIDPLKNTKLPKRISNTLDSLEKAIFC
jgi:hypothetical protein